MSLINKMLQDLEKRRASTNETAVIPNYVRALSDAPSKRIGRTVLLLGLVIVAVFAAAWFFYLRPQTNDQKITVLSAVTPAPAKVAEPAIVELIAKTPVAESSPSPATLITNPEIATVAEVSAAEEPVPGAAEMNLAARMSLEIDHVPVPAPVEATHVSVAENASEHSGTLVPKITKETPREIATRPPKSVSPPPITEAAAAPVEIHKEVKQMTPQQRAEAEYLHALTLLERGKTGGAETALTHVLELYPQHVAARKTLLGLLLESKRLDEGAQLLSTGLAFDRNQPGLAVALARIQVEKGNNAAALVTLENTLQAAKNSPDYIAFLAAVLQRQAKHDEAVTQYRAALELRPNIGVWLMGMGISLQATGRTAEAQDAFSKAIATQTLGPELTAFIDERLKQLAVSSF